MWGKERHLAIVIWGRAGRHSAGYNVCISFGRARCGARSHGPNSGPTQSLRGFERLFAHQWLEDSRCIVSQRGNSSSCCLDGISRGSLSFSQFARADWGDEIDAVLSNKEVLIALSVFPINLDADMQPCQAPIVTPRAAGEKKTSMQHWDGRMSIWLQKNHVDCSVARSYSYPS